jgi:cytochrome P450
MEDVELGGTQLKKGDSVLVAFGAANRDSQKFSCPENIVPDRKPNVHVGFGAGHHRCIGSFIAKVQLQVAFEEIFAQFSGFRVDERRPVKYSSGLNQGIISLPMIFTRAKVESFATTI